MKTYNTQQEVEKDVVNGVLRIDDNVTFTCNIDINADIICHNINANNIYAYDINANNIDVYDINAKNINTQNIDAYNIIANDISYYAVCFAYDNIKCSSIKGRIINSKHFCLNGEITIKQNLIKIETKDGQVISITKEKAKELGFNIN